MTVVCMVTLNEDYNPEQGKSKLNLYLLTDLLILTKIKSKGLMTKTSKEIYITTIMHDSISQVFKVSQTYTRFRASLPFIIHS